MKVLVTGAAGFIGSHVTRLLLEEGHDVRALLQPGAPTTNLDGLDVERVEGDLLDAVAIRRALEGAGLYHLAAIYALWLPQPATMYRVNVEGTRIVMREALASKTIEKVVHTSSIAAVGLTGGREPSDETVGFNHWELRNDYILSKYVSELEVLDFVRRGLPAVVVNPAFPFGDGDVGPTPTGKIIVDALHGRVPGYLPGGFNAVYVGDVARGHLLASARGRVGERYILGGHDVTHRDFLRAIGAAAGVRIPDRRLPSAVVRGAARASEAVSALTGRAPLATVKSVAYLDRTTYFDCTKARTGLGLPTTPLETALERAVGWFRAHGYAP